MGFLVVVIPIACCVLIPAGIAAVAFLGLGKKNKPIGSGSDNKAPQESSRHLIPSRHRRK